MKRRGNRLIIFDDHWSVLHFVLGMVTKLMAHLGLWIVSTVIFVVFVVYEWWEQESRFCKLGDFIEFILGYVFADMVF